ncbi:MULTISPECIES: 4-alpha-glucanotransferase [unclassified Chelatococcus]|uniref:4-alpha-glucanotransferase n=1 Tax=unclassified Chelatococcus TaxID=2638111 RepID=UPI001BCE72EA|nr:MULTISPECIES: 4-alpha-glucanotransferase [unclassified Chelatococcus]CAH1654008.1 4-alpha-glucanotransferase (amylomaltase) [Hyphomicrobiales bacterium]MBS7742838.1 4-alpha-glucanotransferase [Chelatococcus sp. HY11]MBX3542044.1 4-alpha-glucanotransferase [Chelatococcus sp.]MCO5074064.1 4-alpha-glucanotransferase [Chelatococcus sp.]CAH1694727.1 4-alpha-glucanotransferase (amylomaltase) [Hyphomicrobiales bacterium]
MNAAATPDLRSLAIAAGIAVDWTDAFGRRRTVKADTLSHLLSSLGLAAQTSAEIAASHNDLQQASRAAPTLVTGVAGKALRLPSSLKRADADAMPFEIVLENGALLQGRGSVIPAIDLPGYHKLRCADREVTLAMAPRRCITVEDLAGAGRRWGVAAQLYGLRRDITATTPVGNGGIGDFRDLADLAVAVADARGEAVSIGPVHALFTADPGRNSPYAPSSRLFLNPLHADPAAIADFARIEKAIDQADVRMALARHNESRLIDWPMAARAKLALLRALKSAMAADLAPGGTLAEDFAACLARGGQALRDHAVFETLHAACLKNDPGAHHWRQWPAEFHDPRSEAVAAFAAAQAEEVSFHQFLQWLSDKSLAQAQARARDAGLGIGIIYDLAIGTDGGGSYAWAHRDDVMAGVSVGAPPDLFNQLGQDWGLTALSPRTLAARDFAPFLDTLRASMRHAGGLRIDHILGFARLWLVPDGAAPGEGAYLSYPLATMLRLVALESWRHQAIVIGEDLGTVPPGLREALQDIGLLGMRVLWFEREGGAFKEAPAWPRTAAAMTTTHDLPTVAGWWAGRDIDWREKLSLFGHGSSAANERAAREDDRTALWSAFTRQGIVTDDEPPPVAQSAQVVDAAIDFVADTPADLALIPLEDVVGVTEQPNLPGTVAEHPNWRRRLPTATQDLAKQPAAARRLRSLSRRRGKP